MSLRKGASKKDAGSATNSLGSKDGKVLSDPNVYLGGLATESPPAVARCRMCLNMENMPGEKLDCTEMWATKNDTRDEIVPRSCEICWLVVAIKGEYQSSLGASKCFTLPPIYRINYLGSHTTAWSSSIN